MRTEVCDTVGLIQRGVLKLYRNPCKMHVLAAVIINALETLTSQLTKVTQSAKRNGLGAVTTVDMGDAATCGCDDRPRTRSGLTRVAIQYSPEHHAGKLVDPGRGKEAGGPQSI